MGEASKLPRSFKELTGQLGQVPYSRYLTVLTLFCKLQNMWLVGQNRFWGGAALLSIGV